MATLAAIFRRPEPAVAARDLRDFWDEPDPYRLRPLPWEDVYFYTKRIDNSRVVREADPAATRRRWRAVSVSVLASLALMIFLLPDALGLMAGYQIHWLEREHEKLAQDRARLELEEASLLSPDQLERWARELKLVDPDPTHVVYLNPKPDGALAMNIKGK